MAKKILLSTKDENGAYLPSVQSVPLPPKSIPPEPMQEAPLSVKGSDVSLDDVIKGLLLVLERETRNLLKASVPGPLTKDQGVAFERCMKLASDLKKREKELLEDMSDEELEKIAEDDSNA